MENHIQNQSNETESLNSACFYLLGFNPNRPNINQEDPLCDLPPNERRTWEELELTPQTAQ